MSDLDVALTVCADSHAAILDAVNDARDAQDTALSTATDPAATEALTTFNELLHYVEAAMATMTQWVANRAAQVTPPPPPPEP